MPLPTYSDTRLWLALLHEIEAAGGEAKAAVLYDRVRRHFPAISDEDLSLRNASGPNTWQNRVQWVRNGLANAGFIDRTAPTGVWRITPAGRAWLAQHWQGDDADYSGVPKPPPPFAPVTPFNKPADPVPPDPVMPIEATPTPAPKPAPPTHLTVVDPVEALCQQLTKAQRLSDNHVAFELALRDAFTFLGFDATHIGGSSDTDVLLATYLNADSYRVIVDAKSTKSGKVGDGQINWPVLGDHRKQHGADFAAVVGEEFSGGNLKKYAEEYKITLLRTEAVCEIVRLHAQTPFGLLDLRQLFTEVSLSTHGLDSLRRRHAETRRHWRLLVEIVERVEAYNRHVPAGLLPKADTLYHILLTAYIGGHLPMADAPSLPDIQDALAFLASTAVGILRRAPGSDDTYQLVMTLTMARRRLAALSGAVASDTASASATMTGTKPATTTGLA